MLQLGSTHPTINLAKPHVITHCEVSGICNNIHRDNQEFNLVEGDYSGENNIQIHLTPGWYNPGTLTKEVQRAMNDAKGSNGKYSASLTDGRITIENNAGKFLVYNSQLLGFTFLMSPGNKQIADTFPQLKNKVDVSAHITGDNIAYGRKIEIGNFRCEIGDQGKIKHGKSTGFILSEGKYELHLTSTTPGVKIDPWHADLNLTDNVPKPAIASTGQIIAGLSILAMAASYFSRR